MTLEREYNVAIAEPVDELLRRQLLRLDRQEDLTFALYTPSDGATRQTALIHSVVLPRSGDRNVHGNVSFNPVYYQRAVELAAREHCGLALLHSHLGPGWQDMSNDDIVAEEKHAASTQCLTGSPLVGLTVGTDGTWSARVWTRVAPRSYERRWCRAVRVVGKRLKVDFAEALAPIPHFNEMFERTVSVWGELNHTQLTRLRVGIVGLGSVGSLVAEMLARMGLTELTLIDFDELQRHNLDRALGASREDLGLLKVAVAERSIRRAATAENVRVRAVPFSVAEEQGYRAALDCDVLFSCVDRPRARSILNHFAYAHLIPVIDGGIAVHFRRGSFSGVDWQLQTAAPLRPCLECLGAFTHSDAACEKDGRLDDPSYLQGLPPSHHFKRNENVFPFSANLASLEVMQLVALATGIANLPEIGVQRYRYQPGILEADRSRRCTKHCLMPSLTGRGDASFSLCGRDLGAEHARTRQRSRIAS